MYSLWAGRFIEKKNGGLVSDGLALQCQMAYLLTMSPRVKLFIPLSLSSLIYTTTSKRTSSIVVELKEVINMSDQQVPGTNVYSELIVFYQ